jgi:carbamate kinase
MSFVEGSMGPKITAAYDFVWAGGAMAGIGRLQDARAIVEGRAGTRVGDSELAGTLVPLAERASLLTLRD